MMVEKRNGFFSPKISSRLIWCLVKVTLSATLPTASLEPFSGTNEIKITLEAVIYEVSLRYELISERFISNCVQN